MKIKSVGISALVAGAAMLSGCGSDSGSSNDSSFLTYYNLSSDVAQVELYYDDSLVTSVSYENKSTRQTLPAGSETIALKTEEAGDVTKTLYESELDLGKDKRNYLISVGELANGDEPLLFTYESRDLDDEEFEFNLIHLAKDFGDTVTIKFIENEDNELIETFTLAYGESLTETLEGDTYYIQVEDSQGEVLYTSPDATFIDEIQYYFVLKNETLNSDKILTMARLVDSFTSPTVYRDESLNSFFRYYNSAESLGQTQLTLTKGATTEQLDPQDPDSLPELSTELTAGTYKVVLSGSSINGALYNFSAGQDTTLVFYRDEDGKLDDVSFNNTERPSTTNHQVTFVNLLNNQGDDEVDIYFVASDASFETTSYRITNTELSDVARIALPSDYYDIYVAIDDGEGAPRVIAEELNVHFSTDAEAGDWIIFAEPASDTDTPVEGSPSVINRVAM
ncbi:DUF4397 domain-containing protein [Gayadomonas joobiniege]|uniref:DUF4397 domain-containing protein n=1 Tax=Gayadomonas joobiniege TaxID=1234606 RepID=UPI00036B6588|nr:DUF4397 domain-containing protein [Gayadomonas joobiniege]